MAARGRVMKISSTVNIFSRPRPWGALQISYESGGHRGEGGGRERGRGGAKREREREREREERERERERERE